MTDSRCRAHMLLDDGSIPNHPDLPLLVYPDVLDLPGSRGSAAAFVQDLFRKHGWGGAWVNGVFRYHHYHATAHEVLGCFSGSAMVLFGGEEGVEVEIKAGAAVLIPAGVGHKNLGSSADFSVVGAYPPAQSPDMKYGEPSERPQCFEEIARVALPAMDPVFGCEGPMRDLWLR